MTKIFFPYNDQPKQFSFKFPEPIRFPFYVNDLVYFWEVDAHGITLYLHNDIAPALKDIELEESGISMYLYNEQTKVGKHIFLDFAKIGLGLYTLGDLDPLTLGHIDYFTLGEISTYASDWMMLSQSSVGTIAQTEVQADEAQMRLRSDTVVPYNKDIYTGELEDKIGIVGMNAIRHTTLGELDSRTLQDIDSMLSAFRVFESIPASLVKEIKITHTVGLNNASVPLTLNIEPSTEGTE